MRMRTGRPKDEIEMNDARPATILFVEDEPLVLMLAVDVLEDAGFTVLQAENGQEALDILADHPEIEALVTDVNMPGLDGCALAKDAIAARPDLQLIATAGRNRYRNDELPDDGDFLPKPYSPAELVELVRRKLGV